MAKVVWKTTSKAAYEWVEVEGGSTLSDLDRRALIDEYVEENGLVPVESTFVGDVPVHKYGRYKAASATASALPAPLAHREEDVTKLNADKVALEQEVARLRAQLGKQEKSGKGAEVVDGDETKARGTASGGAQTTEDARAAFNEQDGLPELVGSGEEVREDPASNDKSDDNPVTSRRGRKAD